MVVDAGLMTSQLDDGSTGTDQHADDNDGDPAASMTSPIFSITWL
jgi:hypothetical protein